MKNFGDGFQSNHELIWGIQDAADEEVPSEARLPKRGINIGVLRRYSA